MPQQAAVYVPHAYSGIPAQQMQYVPANTTASAFAYPGMQPTPLTSTASQWGVQPQYIASPLAGTQAALHQSRNELVDLRNQVRDLQFGSANLSPRSTGGIGGYPSTSTSDSYAEYLRRRASSDSMYPDYSLSSMGGTSDRFQGGATCCLGCGGPID